VPDDPDMARPSRVLSGDVVVLRRWESEDAPVLLRAVTESLAHLRPWMAWAAGDYDAESVREYLTAGEAGWDAGTDFAYAITVDGEIAGSCGLMARIGPGGLEIGYWLHPRFVGRGLATEAARLLVDAAFGLPEVSFVEIVHDSANVSSGAIPRRLGFVEVARVSPPQEPITAGEDGVDVRWRLPRGEWAT
jgi:RimJ/RimL family protein N-acetyltransferase